VRRRRPERRRAAAGLRTSADVTWEQATNSTIDLAPGLAEFTLASTPTGVANAKGEYPVATPGMTKEW
jgi:hypothetical protein